MQFCNGIFINILYTYKSNISYMRFGILLRLLLVTRLQAVGEAVFCFYSQSLGGRQKRKAEYFCFWSPNVRQLGNQVCYLFLQSLRRWREKKKQGVVLLLVTRCQVVGKAGLLFLMVKGHQVAGKKESRDQFCFWSPDGRQKGKQILAPGDLRSAKNYYIKVKFTVKIIKKLRLAPRLLKDQCAICSVYK